MQHNKFITIGHIKERIAELESQFPNGEPDPDTDDDAHQEWEELVGLRGLESDLHWCWSQDNKDLIKEDYFDTYAEELMYDIGDCQRGGVVAGIVDWSKVSEAVCQDFKKIRVDGEDYWVRQ